MTRPRGGSRGSDDTVEHTEQELGSMYDYLAKVILLGPSGCGKSCLLHRFVKSEWRVLSSQTIGVEFASKIIKIGSGARRKRIKLQLWDTAGTERFRSVSRSYYRGAAGAILVYDLASYSSFEALSPFLNDARALASPSLSIVLVGNKVDLANSDNDVTTAATATVDSSSIPPQTASSSVSTNYYNASSHLHQPSWSQQHNHSSNSSLYRLSMYSSHSGSPVAGGFVSPPGSSGGFNYPSGSGSGSLSGSSNVMAWASTTGITGTTGAGAAATAVLHGHNHRASVSSEGRQVWPAQVSRWATDVGIPAAAEVSALTGDGVDDVFHRLARLILAKIELGDINPDDPNSGIQFGDYYETGSWDGTGGGGGRGGTNGKSGGNDDGGGSSGSVRRRRGADSIRLTNGSGGGRQRGGSNWGGLRDWEEVFTLTSGRRRRGGGGCC